MKFFVANTDATWYHFLARNDVTAEVNFWRPHGRYAAFRAIDPGELFFFRLGRPVNAIAGLGTFAHHSLLPLSVAWDWFGQSNGCATLSELIELIGKRRRENADYRTALGWQVGCTILTNIHYYPESEWLDFSFAPGIMQGKTFELSSEGGARIWDHMRLYLEKQHVLAEAEATLQNPFSIVKESQAIYTTGPFKERSGQGAFRVMVLDAYNRRCCVTGERTLPVLEAAHIQPYVSAQSNHVQNGLALREDVHTLFDTGYVAVDEDYRFVVSPRLREDFENGREYQRFHGKRILLPEGQQMTPSKDAIRWHLDKVYMG